MSQALALIQLVIDSGDIEGALQQLDQLLEEEPTSAAHCLRARLLLNHLQTTENA
jgi:hypothetical protein